MSLFQTMPYVIYPVTVPNQANDNQYHHHVLLGSAFILVLQLPASPLLEIRSHISQMLSGSKPPRLNIAKLTTQPRQDCAYLIQHLKTTRTGPYNISSQQDFFNRY